MSDDNKYSYTPLPEPVPIAEQRWPEETLPLVSTSTSTFNHVAYIRDCIEGILMQKTTFPIRVIIFDDCSTDGTQDIIREYEAKYPHLFFVTYAPENTWKKPIRKEVGKPFREARSKAKYFAMCEGDDYWTDPLKLQKQVDFLEANPEYSYCFHPWRIYNQETKKNLDGIQRGDRTLTLLYRNNVPPLPKGFTRVANGDVVLKFLLSTQGKAKFLPDIEPAVHRHHKGGVWSMIPEEKKMQERLNTAEALLSAFRNTEHEKLLSGRLLNLVADVRKFEHENNTRVLNTGFLSYLVKHKLLKEYLSRTLARLKSPLRVVRNKLKNLLR